MENPKAKVSLSGERGWCVEWVDAGTSSWWQWRWWRRWWRRAVAAQTGQRASAAESAALRAEAEALRKELTVAQVRAESESRYYVV